MDITPSNLESIYLSFNTAFQQGFEQAETWHPKLAMQSPSAGRTNVYAWLGQMPSLREWVGDRQVRSIAAKDHQLSNKDFEATVAVKRNDVLDDQIGVWSPLMSGLGEAAKKWPDVQLASFLEAGESTAHYDGVNFFSATHPIDLFDSSKGTYSNYYTGGSAKPLSAANYQAVRAAMAQTKGEGGRILNVLPDLIIVPPALERTALTLVNADMIPGDAATGASSNTAPVSNILKGSAQVLVVPELTSDTTWYLACTKKPVKPLLFQLREAPVFVQYVSPSDPSVYARREFEYGVMARGAFSGTLPFLISKCKAT